MLSIQFNTTYDLYMITEKGQKFLLKDIFAAFVQTPFAEGTFRECFIGVILDKNKKLLKTADFPLGKCIVKKYKKNCKIIENIKDLVSSFVADHYATQFNNLIKIPNKINFVKPYLTFDKVTKQFVYVEPYLEGKYTKFSSNTGYENPDYNAFIPAFSHLSWVVSKGQYVVLDVQGTYNNNKYYLTDPAIQSVEMKFGDSDLGAMGIMRFLLFHKHNDICQNWTWIPSQVSGVLRQYNASSIARTSFRFEVGKGIVKYTPIYLALLKYIFK